MTWQTEFLGNHRLIQVSCFDHISADDLTILAIETAFLIKQHGSSRVLIDLSKARIGFSATDTQDLLDIYVEYHVPKVTRSAIVVPDQKNRKEMSALTPILEEYGYQLMLFGNIQEARQWLED